MNLNKSIVFLLVLSFLTSCDKGSNTVKIKENTFISDSNKKSKLVLTKTIELDENHYKLGEIRSTTTTVDQRNQEIFISDAKKNTVANYDSIGNFKQLIGKKGRGPGEFIYPTTITVDEKGNVCIFDMKKFSTIIFDKQKLFVREITYPDLYPDTGKLLTYNENRLICLMAPTENASFFKRIKALHLLDNNFNVNRSIVLDFPEIYEKFYLTSFTSIKYDTDWKNIYVNFPALPDVYKYDFNGNLLQVLKINIEDFHIPEVDFSRYDNTLEMVKVMSNYSLGLFLYLFKTNYLFFGYINKDIPTDGSYDITAGKKYWRHYYGIVGINGEQIQIENAKLPGEPLYCTPDGKLYILLSDEPENRKIGVYEIVLEEI